MLTGAGVSTDSGIPDYRDTEGEWKRKPPMTLQMFMGGDLARARYWARSMIGWRRFGRVLPNDSHRALARLESRGRLSLLVTQNVDGLHEAAGSREVVDLHGRLDQVRCMQCDWRGGRQAWQDELAGLNPHWESLEASDAPDGDADLDGVDFSGFRVPPCPRCGGVIKPDVVFWRDGAARTGGPRQRGSDGRRRGARRGVFIDGVFGLSLRGRRRATACRSRRSIWAARAPTPC